MLIGTYQHALDEKGRLIIPAKLREDLGEQFVITRGFNHCLFVYPLARWEVLRARIEAMEADPDTQRAFERLFFAGAVDVEPDKQGRVLIPQHLREHAQIQQDLYINGVSEKVEIWASEQWGKYSVENESSFDKIARTSIRL
jgi:MraZ protein